MLHKDAVASLHTRPAIAGAFAADHDNSGGCCRSASVATRIVASKLFPLRPVSGRRGHTPCPQEGQPCAREVEVHHREAGKHPVGASCQAAEAGLVETIELPELNVSLISQATRRRFSSLRNASRRSRRGSRCWSERRLAIGRSSIDKRRNGRIFRARRRASRRRPA